MKWASREGRGRWGRFESRQREKRGGRGDGPAADEWRLVAAAALITRVLSTGSSSSSSSARRGLLRTSSMGWAGRGERRMAAWRRHGKNSQSTTRKNDRDQISTIQQ